MTLSQAQRQFTLMVARLIVWAYDNGYELTLGEAFRTAEQAALNAKNGTGISNSLHTKRLAIDLNLFLRGVYLTDSRDYLPLGKQWEKLGGTWGGRFTKPDGNHFSLEYEGVR